MAATKGIKTTKLLHCNALYSTFPSLPHRYAATVAMVTTPRAPAPENPAALHPNKDNKELESRMTNLPWETSN